MMANATNTYPYISVRVTELVSHSWDLVTGTPNYQEHVGLLTMQNMLERSPSTIRVFVDRFAQVDSQRQGGNSQQHKNDLATNNCTPQELMKNPAFLIHAKRLTDMVCLSVHLLGPDLDLMVEKVKELGERHVKFGVLPEHYHSFGEALILALSEILGANHWNSKLHDAWKKFYDFIATIMGSASRINNNNHIAAPVATPTKSKKKSLLVGAANDNGGGARQSSSTSTTGGATSRGQHSVSFGTSSRRSK